MNIDQIISDTLNLEGAVADVKGDRGGYTAFGISRRYWPGWKGWDIIDAMIAAGKPVTLTPQLRALVIKFYVDEFWIKMKLGACESAYIAQVLFDFGFNAGVDDVWRVVSKICMAVTGSTPANLMDGMKKINVIAGSVGEANVVTMIQSVRVVKALDECIADQSQKQFLKGWLNRVRHLFTITIFRKD